LPSVLPVNTVTRKHIGFARAFINLYLSFTGSIPVIQHRVLLKLPVSCRESSILKEAIVVLIARSWIEDMKGM